MVQQSKPLRANSFMTEYSPLPGTLRSNAREVTDEPCTKNKTGRAASPFFGAPTRLRNIHNGTSPFLAQYSRLQISPPSIAAFAGSQGERAVSSNLTEDELAALIPSELCQYQTPIPTQIVASDEFYPDPQNERQREVEARLLAMADDLGGKQGLNRRRFFQTAAGMAASFVAMNEVYGPLFDVTKAEAATPAMAQERANALKDQFIMDMHTHFLRDDTRITTFLDMRKAVGKAGWNKELSDHEQTIDDLKFN